MLRDSFPRPPKAAHKMPNNPKPVLEIFRVPIFRVHHTKLEAYIKAVFGFEFDFLSAVAVTPGICVDYDVGVVPGTSEWQKRSMDLRAGHRTREIRLILSVLAEDGYIPKGKYTVSTHPLPDLTTEYTKLLKRTRNPDHPECVQFKSSHIGDVVFTERAAVLDAAVVEQVK